MNNPVDTLQEQPRAKLLIVDDEANILSALRRALRSLGHELLTAESGEAGLALLETQTVDLIITDMRMPGMSGAVFLEQVAERWPDTMRVLLTGHADLTSTIAAINRGHIYRYLSKPWEDSDLRVTVEQALEQRFIRRERDRLLALTHRQNQQLKEWNADLENKVRARTEEIRQTADMLDLAYQELKRSYQDAIPVFANLIEMRDGEGGGHGRRVAEQSRAMAIELGLEEEVVQNIYFAGLLHDIGKLGLSDRLLTTPFVTLNPAERRQVLKHPVMGQAALLALESLQEASLLIRHHHERFDGKGYPDRLAGEAIPLGARILAVVNEYDALQLGTLLEGQLSPDEARRFIEQGRGSRYDPRIATSFLEWLTRQPAQRVTRDLRLASTDLRVGMELSRDLTNEDGLLLLAKGHRLDARLIERILGFEREENRGFTIYVSLPEENDHASNHGSGR